MAKKYFSKAHERAVELKRGIDKAQKAHEKHINDFERKSFTSLPKRKLAEAAFERVDRKLSARENEAYGRYYNHMNKHFAHRSLENEMVKYKDGFADEKFIDHMFAMKSKT